MKNEHTHFVMDLNVFSLNSSTDGAVEIMSDICSTHCFKTEYITFYIPQSSASVFSLPFGTEMRKNKVIMYAETSLQCT